MTQKYGFRANEHIPEDFECEICGDSPMKGTWTAFHGEAVCMNCGVPYKVIHYDEDKNRIEKPPKLHLKEKWIPIIKEYWENVGDFMGLGTILNYRSYPRFYEGRKKFGKWVEENDKEPKE